MRQCKPQVELTALVVRTKRCVITRPISDGYKRQFKVAVYTAPVNDLNKT